MKIKNLTSKVQKIVVAEFVGGNEFTITIQGHGTTELVGMYPVKLFNPQIFQIIKDEGQGSLEEIPVEEGKENEEITEEPLESDLDEESEETDSDDNELTKQFICEACGAEFASARGLNSHMSRVHSENN